MNRLSQKPELRPAREHAPGALAALESAYDAAAVAIDPRLADCLRLRVAESGSRWTPHRRGATHGVADIGNSAPPASERERACFEFTDQFVTYVPGVTEGQREAVGAELGRDLRLELARMIYVFDMTDRLILSLGRLFEPASSRGRGPRARRSEAARRRCRRPARVRDAAARARPGDDGARAPPLRPLPRLQDLTVPSPGGCQARRTGRGRARRGRAERARGAGRSPQSRARPGRRVRHRPGPPRGRAETSGPGAACPEREVVELLFDVIAWSQQKVLVSLSLDAAVDPDALTPLDFDDEGHAVVRSGEL